MSEGSANAPDREADQGSDDTQKTNCPQTSSPRLAQDQIGPFVASRGHHEGDRDQNRKDPQEILDRNRYHGTSVSSLVRVLESARLSTCGAEYVRQIDASAIGPQTLQIVESAMFFVEKMHDHPTVIERDPVALVVT